MSSPTRPMRMRHVNGSVGTAATKITVRRGIGQYVRIVNKDSVNDILFSFDNGRSFNTIAPGTSPFEANALFHFFLIKASGADTPYEVLIGEG